MAGKEGGFGAGVEDEDIGLGAQPVELGPGDQAAVAIGLDLGGEAAIARIVDLGVGGRRCGGGRETERLANTRSELLGAAVTGAEIARAERQP